MVPISIGSAMVAESGSVKRRTISKIVAAKRRQIRAPSPFEPLARWDLLNGEFHGWSTFLESRTLRVPTTLTNQASCRRGSAFCSLAEKENRLDSRSERVRLKASFLCSVRFRLRLAGAAGCRGFCDAAPSISRRFSRPWPLYCLCV
jgi:hypothetical protein